MTHRLFERNQTLASCGSEIPSPPPMEDPTPVVVLVHAAKKGQLKIKQVPLEDITRVETTSDTTFVALRKLIDIALRRDDLERQLDAFSSRGGVVQDSKEQVQQRERHCMQPRWTGGAA